ncbi:Uncharacterized conserved protein, contains FIST_N domain [Oceanospirillum multiglobuliferum]|nr:Uncharacterized conserved protein, contains FIST_N domain [Oceanospirillum multiglobuliferum]
MTLAIPDQHDQSNTRSFQPNPSVVRVMSCQQEAQLCAQELAGQLYDEQIHWVLFFCSAQQDIQLLADHLQLCLPDKVIVGCSTAGEITPLGYRQGSVSAVGFSREGFSIETALIENLDQFDFNSAQHLMSRMLECCQHQQKAPVKGHTFALALLDGMSEHEEVVLNTLSAAFGSIPLLGGSAGDDLDFTHTKVVYQGKTYQNAAVLLMVNTAFPFMVFSQKHVLETDEVFVATEVDSEHRRVYELNAEPAAEVYARAIGVPLSELTPAIFAQHTLSVRIAGEGFVRAVQSVNEDGSLSFYCAVERGIVLRKNKHLDIPNELQRLLDQVNQELGEQQLILGFDCIFRHLELKAKHQLGQVSDLIAQSPMIGFNTYGEHINGIHLNATFTGVAIGY